MKRKRAFSMVEIMVVVVITAILAAVSANMYSTYSAKSKWATVQGCLGDVANRLENYRSNHGKYPEEDIWTGINSSGECGDYYEGRVTVFNEGQRYIIVFCDRKAPIWSKERNDVWAVIDTRPNAIHLANSVDEEKETIDAEYLDNLDSDCAPSW